jgi:hypothetical protein
MGEFLLGLGAVILCSCMAFHLGVRRERGRQMRYEEVKLARKVPKQGVKLKRTRLRR